MGRHSSSLWPAFGASHASRNRARAVLAALAVAGISGCTGMGTTVAPVIMLSVEEGARWIGFSDLERYRCARGVLVCSSEAGRLTARLCRCLDSGGANAFPQAE